MISGEASIPKGIFAGDDIDIVIYGVSNGMKIVGVADIHIPDQHCHAKGQEKNVSFVGIFGPELPIHLDFVDEVSLH